MTGGRRKSGLLAGITLLFVSLLAPAYAVAAGAEADSQVILIAHWAGLASLAVFILAYLLVISEEAIHLRKSKPMMVSAGIIWVMVAIAYAHTGNTQKVDQIYRHDLLDFAELFLFLLAAMTYINTMEERGLFNKLRVWLILQGFSLRTIYWLTGILTFLISPLADNLTTALLMSTVAITVAPNNDRFITVSCINIVVAANAGGAFSPFGDITTLMVWQSGLVDFSQFFHLVLPSLANWLIPAIIMGFTVPLGHPEAVKEEAVLQHGAWVVVGLFIITISMAVMSHNLLHMPPVLGMMTGLGLLKGFGFYLQKRGESFSPSNLPKGDHALALYSERIEKRPYDIYLNLMRSEWDTLMFFYGIILSVGGLSAFGYFATGSEAIYGNLGATTANTLVGLASAVVDNIPVMFAVLEMHPAMSLGHWLMVTLTAGVGGSLLSIGSAAGVAVMGQARGHYTFLSHLKWSWAILLGYAASIATHFLLNASLFTGGAS
jgi:Na+/H+ antiporter NhaD/arsenite permease-like protein